MFSHLPQPLLIIQKSGHHFHPKQQRKRIGCALAVAKKHVLRFLRFIMLKLRPSRMGPGLKLVPGLGSSKNHGPVGPVDTPIINSPNRKRCTFWRISNIKIPTCSHVPLLFLETVKYISGKKGMEMWWNVYITIQKLCKALYSNIEDATTGTSSQGQTDLQGYPIVHLRLMFKHVLVAKKNQSNAKHNKHDTYSQAPTPWKRFLSPVSPFSQFLKFRETSMPPSLPLCRLTHLCATFIHLGMFEAVQLSWKENNAWINVDG